MEKSGSGLTLDSGALIAWERADRFVLGLFKATRPHMSRLTVPALVLAETWRGNSRRIARLLGGCIADDFDWTRARAVGELLARSRTKDVVDAAVVLGALGRGDAIVTSDPDDMHRLLQAAGAKAIVVPV